MQAPESLVHRLMHGYAEMYQVPHEQLAQFEQQFHEIAAAQVRRDLVLDAVVEANGLRATEAELDQRVGGARGGPRRPGRPALRQPAEGQPARPSSSAPSPRRRPSPGSSSSPLSTR